MGAAVSRRITRTNSFVLDHIRRCVDRPDSRTKELGENIYIWGYLRPESANSAVN